MSVVSTLICGSMAYDNIMVFQDRFKNHIFPDQIHILNVSFTVPEMRRVFGGCAGNIAYNLKLLGDNPLIMATLGEDGAPYLDRLKTLGLPRTHVREIPGSFTAQAFITTDLDGNQITAFHPGAMSFSHHNHVSEANEVSLGILAPDGRDGMIAHAEEFVKAGIPFIFDLGQAMPLFSGDELLKFLKQADYACFNDYEIQAVAQRTGLTIEALANEVTALIVTHGGEGSTIYAQNDVVKIPCTKADAIVDPTGCGDAYRAGLLYGISRKWEWDKTGRLASVMGAIKVAHAGCQNHAPSRDEILKRFAEACEQ